MPFEYYYLNQIAHLQWTLVSAINSMMKNKFEICFEIVWIKAYFSTKIFFSSYNKIVSWSPLTGSEVWFPWFEVYCILSTENCITQNLKSLTPEVFLFVMLTTDFAYIINIILLVQFSSSRIFLTNLHMAANERLLLKHVNSKSKLKMCMFVLM